MVAILPMDWHINMYICMQLYVFVDCELYVGNDKSGKKRKN